jgi:serine/threonine protein kinase
MKCPSCDAEAEKEAVACFACGAPLSPALASLATGSVFATRFEILGPLGRGGMGMVYKALDRELGETVAIKVLRPDVASESGRVVERFRSEIRLARRVRHRNVCSVYGDGEDRGLLFICMELVEGDNLAHASREGGGLPAGEAWDALLQVMDGLEAIHEVGVVHRDLKTANLMRDRRGQVKVMDFGIAKQHGATEGGVTVTATGSLMGTPEYMSPEQLRGEAVGFRSDLYSLGVVTYELFTGQLPFRGDTPVATIVKQLQEPPQLDAWGLPDALRSVLLRTLAKDPAERHANVADLRREVQAARGAAPVVDTRAGTLPSVDETEDETRPVRPGALPVEPAPIVRIALANLGLVLLAGHLLGAGGAVVAAPRLPPPPPRDPAPEESLPAPEVTVRVAPASPALSRAHSPHAVVTLPARPLRALARSVPEPKATSRALAPVDLSPVYEESEVDVKPRRITGMNASYPEWGPRLSRGDKVSIVASFVVTEQGDVTDIQVEEGGGALEAVLLEISRWKYEPGLKDGVPVKVRVQFRHTFIGG